MPTIDDAEIDRRFLYHAPDEGTRAMHDKVRDLTLEFAYQLGDLLDRDTREKSLAFTALEEMSFWTHADIARNR